MVLKIFNGILITAEKHMANHFISSVKYQYKLGTIAFISDPFIFRGSKFIQDTELTIRIHEDD